MEDLSKETKSQLRQIISEEVSVAIEAATVSLLERLKFELEMLESEKIKERKSQHDIISNILIDNKDFHEKEYNLGGLLTKLSSIMEQYSEKRDFDGYHTESILEDFPSTYRSKLEELREKRKHKQS